MNIVASMERMCVYVCVRERAHALNCLYMRRNQSLLVGLQGESKTPWKPIFIPIDLETVLFTIFFFFFFCLSRAVPAAYVGSQARGWLGAVAADHSHSKAGSELRLWPTPQLPATPDP